MNLRKKRVNDTAIVVVDGQKIYTRTGVNDEVWLKILEQCEAVEVASTESHDSREGYEVELKKLYELIDPIRVAEQEKYKMMIQDAINKANLDEDIEKRIKKAKRITDASGLFEYDDNGITYLRGFKYPMNGIMVDALLEAQYNPNSRFTVNSLVNFWKYLLLNPDKHVREGLFNWIKTSKFALTDDGNIIAYRNVDIKKHSSNKAFHDFIGQSWTKIKGQKKSPKNYFVYDNNGTFSYSSYVNEDGKLLGTVADLFERKVDDCEETIYTDNYTRKMEIKIGTPVRMPRSECDNDPNSSCSRGLHAKSSKYNLELGSDVIVTLVNPYNVVAIPTNESTKFRCCEYYPVSKAELDNGRLVEFQPGTYDIPYNGIESLVELLETTSLVELQSSGNVSDSLQSDDFQFVIEAATRVISNRNVNVND